MEAMRHDLGLVAGLLQRAEMSALEPEHEPEVEHEPVDSVQLGLFG